MNKKLIIIIAIVLVVVIAGGIAAFMLLGNKNSEEDEFLPAGFDVEADNLKFNNLTFYFEGSDNAGTSKEVLLALNSKLKRDLNAELQFNFVFEPPEAYLNRLKTDISAGKPCDGMYFSEYFPFTLETLAKEGYAADLTELFPRNAPRYYSQFTQDDIDAIEVQGKIYAVPERIPNANRTCVIVRQDLMEKYNIPEIKSYADYEVFLKTIKEKEPGKIPMNYYDTTLGLFADANGYVVLDYQLGLVYKWDDPDVKIQAWEQTPLFKDCLNTIISWKDNDYLMKNGRNAGIAQTDQGMVTSGTWASFIDRIGSQFNYNALVRAKGITDWSYKAYQLHDGFSARLAPLANGLVVNAKSQYAERVLMFIDWLQSSQENYDLYMYGVKGKHYVEKQDYIEPPEGVKLEESFFSWGWKAPFRNIDYERANTPNLKEEIAQYYDIIKEKTKYPPLNGFRPDYSAVSSIKDLRQLSYSEMDRSIFIGSYDESKVDTYIKEQKDAGIDNLISEVQRQADRFRAGH
ncbi:MAG TPA: extracellular solute-binding protein [Clostridia bacterium]|nr:extracellular solute-binding protein [Clostridia bacterium]